jgi:hypothetical protein
LVLWLLALSLHSPPATHTATPQVFLANAVTDPITGATLEYRDLLKGTDRDKWTNGWANEFRRLGPTGTNTLQPLLFTNIPKDRAIGNIRVVAAYKPLKEEHYRIRFTVAHHHHDYVGDVSTPTIEMPTVMPPKQCYFHPQSKIYDY